MKQTGFGFRFFIAALLLGLGTLAAFGAYKLFRQEATPVTSQKQSAEAANDGLVRELTQGLQRPKLVPGHFRIIEEKTLFDPDREPWQPPPPEPEKEPEPKADIPRIERTDVIVHGTYLQDKKKYAILSLPRLKSKRPRFILNEGETVHSDDPKSDLSYTLVAVESGEVVMKDQAGEAFRVGLEQRGSDARTTVNQSSVTVTRQTASGAAAPRPAVAAPTGATVTQQQGERLRPSRLPKAQREKLLREGKLVEVKMPVGTMLKYADE